MTSSPRRSARRGSDVVRSDRTPWAQGLVAGPPPRGAALVIVVLIGGAGYLANQTDVPMAAVGPGLLAALLAPLWLPTVSWLLLDLVLSLAVARVLPLTPVQAVASFLGILVGAVIAG